jgi:Protein of unknown function (DUF3703)
MSTTTTMGADRHVLRDACSAERAEASRARLIRDFAEEWSRLERAHILSQPMAVQHVRTHLAMLAYGMRQRDRRELVGQLGRLLVAGLGTVTGRYPAGNTGGANVRAMAVMPIPDDLRLVIEAVAHSSRRARRSSSRQRPRR